MDYDELVNFLKDNGYVFEGESYIQCHKKFGYRFSKAKGKGVVLGFGEVTKYEVSPYTDGKIAADNIDCFDKWSKCPLVLKFPNGENQAQELLKMLEHLGSKEGYELSNGYGYLDNNPYYYKKRR